MLYHTLFSSYYAVQHFAMPEAAAAAQALPTIKKTTMPDCIALVTARGGSKRLPRKNALPLAGIPLVSWSIKAALEAKSVRRVIMSTDDAELMNISAAAGAEVPFVRPTEHSGDTSNHYGVVAHALDWIEANEGKLPQFVILLQPTSPLRTAEDIDGLIMLVEQRGGDSGFAVSPVETHPAYIFRLDHNLKATPLIPRGADYIRSQDLEPLFRENGAGYVFRPATFRQRQTILGQEPLAYIMPAERSIDVDTELDFAIAAALIAQRKS